jgi:hypothetical protein
MLVDKSYFIGPLTIAQIGDKAVQDRIKDFINKFEPLVLEAALGYDFYALLEDGIKTTDKRWTDLKDGLIFSNLSTIRKKFNGLGNTVAGFIYYEYMRDLVTQNTGIGIVKSQGENSSDALPNRKMVDAFNESSRQIHILWEYMQANLKLYPEFDYKQVQGYSFGYNQGFVGNQVYSFRHINMFGI